MNQSNIHTFDTDAAAQIHVCLLSPAESLNVGSVARVMSNFGFQNLLLCQPRDYDEDSAKRTACWAKDVLEGAQVYSDVGEMLSSMEDVVGFTSTSGKNWTGQMLLADWVTLFSSQPLRKTALLFGPEDHGLTKEDLQHCSHLVRIPSSEKNPSFNLSHAVALALYELSRNDRSIISMSEGEDFPTWNDFEQVDRLLEEILEEVRFSRGGEPGQAPAILKSLFRRTSLNKREAGLLLSFLGRVNTELRYRAQRSKS
ncbi:MAG: hypothetical protein KDD64_02365 [Bdellovibrionales bacterium]|nr:hypothetical protein [Bdellovibrionales bacterium]